MIMTINLLIFIQIEVVVFVSVPLFFFWIHWSFIYLYC